MIFTNYLSLAFELKRDLKVQIILNILQLQRYAENLRLKIIVLYRVRHNIHHLLFAKCLNDLPTWMLILFVKDGLKSIN